jgi:hypothetical protein
MIGRSSILTNADNNNANANDPNANWIFGPVNFVATLPKNNTSANMIVNIVYLPDTEL